MITDPDAVYPLGRHLALFEHADRQLGIAEISAPEAASQFVPSRRVIPTPRVVGGVVWVRLQVRNGSSDKGHWWLALNDPRVAHVDLYTPDPGAPDGFRVERSGSEIPFFKRAIKHRAYLFDVALAPGELQTLYLRVESKGGYFALPLSLWPPDQWSESTQMEYWLLGLFSGALLMVLGYNLVLYIFLRDPTFLYLVLFIAGITAWRATWDGLTGQFLFGGAAYAHELISITAAIALAALVRFTMCFLETSEQGGVLHRALGVLTGFYVLVTVLVLPGIEVAVMLNASVPLAVALTSWAAIAGLRRGNQSARWYLIAWGAFFATLLALVAANEGFITRYPGISMGNYIGITAVALLFSLALADRFRLLQAQALAISREKEQLVRDQKDHLEREVSARTEQLTQARERAESANRAKDELLANVSHELRTPMNAVLGFTELLAQAPQSEPQRSHLEHIRSAGMTLQRLIDDLLDLSHIEARALTLRPGLMNPHALIRELEREHRARAEAKGLRLRVNIDPDLPEVLELDCVRVRQVLSNLLGNAIKYSESGEIELSLDAEPAGDGSVTLSAAVRDTGPGVPEEHQADIFTPFLQLGTSNHTRAGGVGLGLAVCHRLAALMGGEIQLRSQPGQGSRFTLMLPKVQHGGQVSSECGGTAVTPRFRGTRILIADDELWNRDLLRAYLSDRGIVVDTAENGERALQRVREQRPDLILMDIGMPVMDGLSAIRSLRDSTAGAIPVIAVTAAAMGSRAEQAARLADAVVTKPVTRARLLDEIARFLPHDVVEDASPGSTAAGPIPDPAGAAPAPDLASAHRARLEDLLAADRAFREAVVTRLHNGPTQDLAALRVEMQALARQERDAVSLNREQFAGFEERIGRINQQIRSAMFDLGLDQLLTEGLREALASLADYLQANHGITVSFRAKGEVPLPAVTAHRVLHALLQRLRDLEERIGISAAGIYLHRREEEMAISVEVQLRATPGAASAPLTPPLDIALVESLAPFGITLTEHRSAAAHHLEFRLSW